MRAHLISNEDASIAAALRNEPLLIHGDGGQTRSFCFVDDLIDGLCRLMDLRVASTDRDAPLVNLGNPTEHVSVLALARLVLSLVPESTSTVKRVKAVTDDPARRQPDITRARELLSGWEPRVSLTEGLSKTIPYFENL